MVVTGVVAADPPPALATSSPSLPTVKALPLHFPQWRHVRTAALQGCQWTIGMQGRPRDFSRSTRPRWVPERGCHGGCQQEAATCHACGEHAIETTAASSVASRYRQLNSEWLAAAKAEFAAMESQGIILCSKSS